MSRRWTQQEEDSARLPEGFKRTGYDADTRRYYFRDANGTLYQGEPDEEYGILKAVPPNHSTLEQARHIAFAPAHERRPSSPPESETPSAPPPKTFYDILPPELITSSSISSPLSDSPPPSSAIKVGSRFVKAVRKSTLPKMQGVAHTLRRSVTTIRKPKSSAFIDPIDLYEGDTIGLISKSGTNSTSVLDRPPFPNGPRSIPPRRSTLDVNFTSSS